MAHRTSSPALHAARVVLMHWDLTVKPEWKEKNPKLLADERCVAIIIDYGSQIFNVVELRPELRYWQDRMGAGTASPSQLAAFLRRVIQAIEKLPRPQHRDDREVSILDTPPGATWNPPRHEISMPALEAARALSTYYEIIPIESGKSQRHMERTKLAVLIDVSIHGHRCLKILPVIQARYQQLVEGRLSAGEVGNFLRALGVQLDHLPSYQDQNEETKLLSA